jgi:hypothetical protein
MIGMKNEPRDRVRKCEEDCRGRPIVIGASLGEKLILI